MAIMSSYKLIAVGLVMAENPVITLTLIIGGGAKLPTANLKDYFSATECPIDLKPSCIFKFVRCLEVYIKILVNLDLGGTLEGLLSARVPRNQPRRVHFRGHLGVHEGP